MLDPIVTMLLFGALMSIGTGWLAYEMGRNTGYRYGYDDAEHDITCDECRMSEANARLEYTHNNTIIDWRN